MLMLLWWHLLVLVILLFGDESFVVIGRHRARVVWLERAQRGGCGSAARRWVERSGPWRGEALGRGRAWSGSEAELPCERRRGREIERALALAARADDGNFSAARPAVLGAHWSGSRGNRWLPPGRQDLFRWHRVF